MKNLCLANLPRNFVTNVPFRRRPFDWLFEILTGSPSQPVVRIHVQVTKPLGRQSPPQAVTNDFITLRLHDDRLAATHDGLVSAVSSIH